RLFLNPVTAGTIASDQTVCSGSPAVLTNLTAGTGAGIITYQWQLSTDGGTTWTNIAGATSASYTAPAVTQNTLYRRITISTLNGVSCTATGNTVAVSVNPISPGTISADQTLCTG